MSKLDVYVSIRSDLLKDWFGQIRRVDFDCLVRVLDHYRQLNDVILLELLHIAVSVRHNSNDSVFAVVVISRP